MTTNPDITQDVPPGIIRGPSGVQMVVNSDGSINTTSSGGGTASTSINIVQIASASVATGHGTAAGALRVELPTDGTGVVALASTASNITQVAGAAIAQGHGTAATAIRVELPTDGTGVVGLNAGSAIVGKVGVDQTTPGTTNAVQAIPGTSGGMSKLSTLVANNTTAVVVKNSAGQVYAIECFNLSTTIAYLKIYDATSATAGSGTPTARYMIPGSAGPNGAGFVVTYPVGDTYTTGITQVVVTGFADNDATAPAASTYIVNVHYK